MAFTGCTPIDEIANTSDVDWLKRPKGMIEINLPCVMDDDVHAGSQLLESCFCKSQGAVTVVRLNEFHFGWVQLVRKAKVFEAFLLIGTSFCGTIKTINLRDLGVV